MSPIEPSWGAPLLSSPSASARAAYREGVIALVAGLPHARALFERAIGHDPSFFLAHVARLLTDADAPASDLPTAPLGLTLGERQHVAVVREHLAGDPQRAYDLRRQHLAELPGDLLVVWLPTRNRGISAPSAGTSRVQP